MSTPEPASLRTVLVGADSLLIECGEAVLAKGHHIVAVAAGSPRVASWATAHDLPVIDATGDADEWQGELAAYQFDWLFAITHRALLPDAVLAMPAQGAVNFHDGPLPRYAGLNTPAWALMRGEETYGITWHVITAGIAEGAVLKEATFEVAAGETSLSLNTRNFEVAIESFGELLDEIALGTHVATPQDPSRPRTTYSRHDRPPALAVLDWRAPAVELERLVRALTFGPYPSPLGFAKLWAGDQVLLVTAAELVDDDGDPGTVLELDENRIVVACREGALALTELTTQRGGAIDISDAARQLALHEGAVLPTLADDQGVMLTEIGRRLSLAERWHQRELRTLEPLEAPWARTPAVDHVARHDAVPVAVPSASDAGAVVAALGVLLARISGKARFHLGVVDENRSADLDAAGAFVSDTVPLAIAIDEDDELSAVVDRVRADLTIASQHMPFAHELVARDPELARVPELAAGRLVPISVRLGATAAPADGVVVELQQADDGWTVQYDRGLIDVADAELLVSCLESVLVAVDRPDPSMAAAEVDLLGPELRQQVLEGWNDTARAVRDDACIHQLFEEQVDRTPDVDAVVFEDRSITYRELDDRANSLAHHLIALGVGPDGLVGVHVRRGIDLVVAVTAVHKAGGAYVPLDPVYPTDRLEHMIRDSRCAVILTEGPLLDSLPLRDDPGITVVVLDRDRASIDSQPRIRPAIALRPDHLSYCIYTSGSTGLPKGVLIEHRNVVNFFAGMDERVPHDLPATWFAVTSLSFDISVLELLYTITRGFTVVVYLDRERAEDETSSVEAHVHLPMDFSLFYFSGDAAEGAGAGKYRLLLEGARFADDHGFRAVWTPERHFHAFGGLYPQPAVTSAAVAAITKNVAIRAGSVVMPLHHPIRVAEAWSIVDNLSDGRVGISIASGWQPNDFVLMPENFANAKQAMFDGLEVVQRLWRGETVTFDGPTGNPVEVTTLPRPVQPELPVWITSAGNPATYIQAGRIGANVLTHLLGQSVEQLAPKIDAYRQARQEAGFDPDAGIVSLMLHTFVGDDEDEVREAVREPLKAYLGESFSLLREYAWSFPAFQRPAGSTAADDGLGDDAFRDLSPEDLDAVLEFAFLRYYETSGLFGTEDRCREMVDRLKGIGVNEIACLIDFGVDIDRVLASLPSLDLIRQACNQAPADTDAAADAATDLDQSVAAQLRRHAVTHLQCTPSMARMLSLQEDSRAALAEVEHLFVGGEAFPVALAQDLRSLSRSGNVTNMYGPTETTIWSTTWALEGPLDSIPIGTPIANTQIYILDQHRQPLPPGIAGELWIGGDGVVRGYHEQPELTTERFVPDPFRGGDHRMYLTGDLARWRVEPGQAPLIEFLGRIDHQVKIRGYRIELGEIEAQIGRFPGVREAVAVVREDTPGDQQLLAYLSTTASATVEPAAVKDHLRATLPDVMVPAHISVLDDLPHTPNGKIDRNGLPSLAEVLGRRAADAAPVAAGNDFERSVLTVWEETLGTTGIGVDDNFFDIGGHSLLIVRMHRRLRDELDPSIALTDLYRFPTVRGFAASRQGGTQASTQTTLDRAARRRDTMQRRRRR